MNISPIFLKDFYKVGHIDQYPKGTNLIFSNFTPRRSMIKGISHSILFGLKYLIKKYLIEEFDIFFQNEKSSNEYKDFFKKTIGSNSNFEHIEKLRKLGYLPIEIYSLPELSIVPCGVPALVMFNTHPDFYWVPNMLETLISCTLWGASTSATIARQYRMLLDEYAYETSDIKDFVDYQAHDFSMRGMSSVESACISGMAHLQYFKGTDTIPAVIFNNHFYSNPIDLCSVPATEHSVMSSGGKENEFETYKRLITEIYPEGIISIVSDTWNLWNVINEYLPKLKSAIINRNGRVVIRPDSGDPIDILCGDEKNKGVSHFGVIELLWNIFGGEINSKGYKQLDPHIGVIYGDSITLERANIILEKLKNKGFSSTNIVFGIGSYTYQYNTRDTFGWAMKSTYIEINGCGKPINKDPITDNGTKKSHSGILKVIKIYGSHGYSYEVLENQNWNKFYEENNELKLIFKDGKLSNEN